MHIIIKQKRTTSLKEYKKHNSIPYY